jgi:hypothetical protein
MKQEQYKIHMFRGRYELWVPDTGERLRDKDGFIETFSSFGAARKRLYEVNGWNNYKPNKK